MTDIPTLKGKTAIVGIGELPPLKRPDHRTGFQLMIEAAKLAIEDAGIDRSEIDGVLVAPPTEQQGQHAYPSYIAEYLRLPLRYGNIVELAGASAAATIWRASAAIAAGVCNTVLCALGESTDTKLLYNRVAKLGPQDEEFCLPYGPMMANGQYAMIAQRHSYEYGTTPAQRARIAVAQRANACVNPMAVFYGHPTTIDDVLNSRIVCDPLHLLEIVRPCSGGAAVIVTSAERTKRMPKTPVKILGAAEYITHQLAAFSQNMTTSPVASTAPRAMQMAGVTHKDIDLLSIYDCYTIMVMLTIEDAGFCKKGQVGRFVEEHDLTYKGDFPINTHGGQISFGQAGLAGGMSHVTEAVRQLRGEAGERQLKKCDVVFVNGNGGAASEEVSLIFGR